MKYEILKKQAKESIDNLKISLEADKSDIERQSKALQDMEQVYKNQFLNIAGIGCFAFAFQLIKFHQTKESMQKYLDKKNFTKEAEEWLHLQRERYDIVELAKKNGLKVDFNLEKEVEDFLTSSQKYSGKDLGNFLKQIGKEDVADLYEKISSKSKQFLKETAQNLVRKKDENANINER